MPVRDLVGLYQSRVQSSPLSSENTKQKHTHPSDTPSVDGLPGPSLSRTSQVYTPVGSSSQSSFSLTASETLYDHVTTDTHDTLNQTSADVTDEFNDYHKNFGRRMGHSGSLIAKPTTSRRDDAMEMKKLLPPEETWNGKDLIFSEAQSFGLESIDSTHTSSSLSHAPVPATAVFSRAAAPLSFPKLDARLSAIPPPSFRLSSNKDGKPTMFPPLQLLSASGQTLADLEQNAQVPHWWQNRNTIIGALASLALSITVGCILSPRRYFI